MFVDTNGYSADFDFDRNTIYFVDYNMFSHDSDKALIDAASLIRSVAPLFQKDDAKSYERYGREITFRLGDYGIPMVHKNGRYYIPLQTFSDVFLSAKSFFSLYNGIEDPGRKTSRHRRTTRACLRHCPSSGSWARKREQPQALHQLPAQTQRPLPLPALRCPVLRVHQLIYRP